jgi:hypothetical protein
MKSLFMIHQVNKFQYYNLKNKNKINFKVDDAPRKRVDKCKTTSPNVFTKLSIGSPAIPRRGLPISYAYVHLKIVLILKTYKNQ